VIDVTATVIGPDRSSLLRVSRRTPLPAPGAARTAAAVVGVGGSIDLDTVDLLRTALLQTVDRYEHVECDLGEATFLSAAGVTALIEARARAVARGHAFSLSGARGAVLRVLRISNLDQMMD
jgi:anti-anti-sigma factor